MDSRRDFLKKATLLTSGFMLSSMVPESIQRAIEIDAAAGSTFYDAEHVVFLMQENRSFDHMFGTLKGVRGFNNPHPHILPNKNKVWMQQNEKGETFAPFHLDLNQTKITWQGGLPHSWPDQTAARNKGKYDKWISAKTLMTMGHYNRLDLPFYYAFADAFTVCDHSFCSSLTGTTPNRLFFFTGANTANAEGGTEQIVQNSQAESRDGVYVDWLTLPEVLEDNGIDWRVYQNEIWTSNLPEEQDDWVGNYGDNPLEYIKRYNVRLSSYFRKFGDKLNGLSGQQVTEKYNALSQREKNLIDKAFTTNIENEDYLKLAPFDYKDVNGTEQTINIPKEDIFHQFRKDVNEGKLPAVSWLVAPQRFSDHTSSPLYGSWYLSETLDILTKNPEVWKKTIFVLTYDENDGYFDHLPPFVAPKPNNSNTGKCSENINAAADYHSKDDAPIGLGYRIPMVVASPWSKGGFVNSEVFDHTSSVQFLEKFLSKKTGKNIFNPQVTSWRRAVCGDLTSVFRPYNGEKYPLPAPLQKNEVITAITNAKNKPKQLTPNSLSASEIENINTNQFWSKEIIKTMPSQERGTKPACALPYYFDVNAVKTDDGKLQLVFKVDKKSEGIPFNVTALNLYEGESGKNWNFAVVQGDKISYDWDIDAFENGEFALAVHAPNGFYRVFKGTKNDFLDIKAENDNYRKGKLKISIKNNRNSAIKIAIADKAYGVPPQVINVSKNSETSLGLSFSKSENWYNLQVTCQELSGMNYLSSGHIETKEISSTDPFMGGY